ncbi:hypothetical protein EON65_13830, partial [archaeon]
LIVHLDQLSVCPMSSTTLDSLNLSEGDCWIYSHHYHCEHVLVVLGILLPAQLVTQDSANQSPHIYSDSGLYAMYPKESYRARCRKRRCDVCKVLSAEFIVYHDRLASGRSAHLSTFFCK